MTEDLRPLIAAWAAMMVLLALTYAASLTLTGMAGLFTSLAIAFAKAGLIYWYFMEGRKESGLIKLAALAASAWLLILFTLTFSDYLTR